MKQSILYSIERIGANRVFRRIFKNIIVLMYHGVVPDSCDTVSYLHIKESEFRKQMLHLKKYYNVIPINKIIDRLNSSSFNSMSEVVITFDDGYRNNFTYAYPILRELDLPASIFLTSGYIDTDRLFWWDKVQYAVERTRREELDLTPYGLAAYDLRNRSIPSRDRIVRDIADGLKEKQPVEIERITEWILKEYAPDLAETDLFRPLITTQIKTMLEGGLITFGSHTHNHKILTTISLHEAEEEIVTSRDYLERITGRRPVHFCYPNGNYNNEIINLLKKLGYSTGFTDIDWFCGSNTSQFEIPRFPIGRTDSIENYSARLSGLKFFIRTPLRRIQSKLGYSR